MKIKTTMERVKAALKDHSTLRDNDRLLCAYIWKKELNTQLNEAFIDAYKSGKLTNAETIRRARQHLQLKHPSLRGKNYRERMARQAVVKKELGYKVK